MRVPEKVTPSAEPPESAAAAGRRMSLVTVDQGLSSLSNLLVLVAVAHLLEPVDFGRFSLLFLVYALGQALVRSAVSVPVLVHTHDALERPQEALGAAILLGLAVSGLCVAAGGLMWWAADVMAASVLVLGACLPFLLLHDVGRYLAFARGKPGRAIELDLLWLLLTVGGFVLVIRQDAQELSWIVLAWAGSGAAASLWAFAQYGVPRGRALSMDWVRERWSFVWRSVVSNVAAQGIGLMGGALAAVVSSPVAVAVLRASLLVGRPSATVQAGVGASTAADVAREGPADGGARLLRRALVVCWAVAVINLGVLYVLPDAVGTAILGGVWPLVEPLILPIGLFGVAAAVHTAVQAVLVGRHEMTRVLWLELSGACLAVVCVVVGAAVGDAAGALWGTLIGQSIASIAWWISFRRYLARRDLPKAGRHRRDASTGS